MANFPAVSDHQGEMVPCFLRWIPLWINKLIATNYEASLFNVASDLKKTVKKKKIRLRWKHGKLDVQQFNGKKIPLAGALRVWRLTFSLQLPWFPEGLFPSWSDSFFIVTATAETCHPCSHDDRGDNKSPRIQLLGTDPRTHSLSGASVHCKREPSVKVIYH